MRATRERATHRRRRSSPGRPFRCERPTSLSTAWPPLAPPPTWRWCARSLLGPRGGRRRGPHLLGPSRLEFARTSAGHRGGARAPSRAPRCADPARRRPPRARPRPPSAPQHPQCHRHTPPALAAAAEATAAAAATQLASASMAATLMPDADDAVEKPDAAATCSATPVPPASECSQIEAATFGRGHGAERRPARARLPTRPPTCPGAFPLRPRSSASGRPDCLPSHPHFATPRATGADPLLVLSSRRLDEQPRPAWIPAPPACSQTSSTWHRSTRPARTAAPTAAPSAGPAGLRCGRAAAARPLSDSTTRSAILGHCSQ
mmetsp:Transcript_46923/g.133398  ORF Transcript_46923/g.133398 Transcript_46923/m.133398 type:complete len:320 (+) Transcript_46923:88-1047(+)